MALSVAACGRLGFTEAAVDGDAAAAPRCAATSPWSTPIRVAELNSPMQDASARFADGERLLVLSSARPGGPGLVDVFEARRSTELDPFPAPTLLPFSSVDDDYTPTTTGDGLTLVVQRGSSTSASLALTRRAATGATFAPLAPLEALGVGTAQQEPWLTPDGSGLYFAALVGGNLLDLFYAPASGDSFGPAVAVAGLATSAEDRTPVVSADERTIYFASDRAGVPGVRSIWVATRDAPGADFGAPSLVPELSSNSDDYPTWLSADECRIYLTSNRDGGDFDIWAAERTPS